MKKQIVSGLIGAAALLLSTSAFAQGYKTCTSGTLLGIGSGDVNAASKVGDLIYSIRWIKVRCDDTSGTLAGVTGTYYFYPTTDPDGKLAIALTSGSDKNKVSYTLYPGDVWCVQLSEILPLP